MKQERRESKLTLLRAGNRQAGRCTVHALLDREATTKWEMSRGQTAFGGGGGGCKNPGFYGAGMAGAMRVTSCYLLEQFDLEKCPNITLFFLLN